MANKSNKGVAGNNTGASARAAIREAQKIGLSLEQIGRASNRSASTISQIKAGEIKNPPANLAGMIRRARKRR